MNEFTTGPLTLQEMIKIASLMENPPEAVGVRRALRFYEVPEMMKNGPWKWGNNEELRKVMYHYVLPQSEDELQWMCEYIKNCTSLLEIGSSFGGALERMVGVMPKGSLVVSVDQAVDDTPKFLNPTASLKDACRRLSIMGANVELFIGDSHAKSVVDAVSQYAPFDFCFIDGDHSYEGMKADWENYGPMARMVGFHDIHGALADCRRFWQDLKGTGEYKTAEIMSSDPLRTFGIGVVFREG